MKWIICCISIFLHPLLVNAAILDPKFSLDPASSSIDNNITPDDVLKPGPAVFTQGVKLGLQDNFFAGVFDNLNALSYGQDPIQNPLYFSVDEVAIGQPGTDVNLEAFPGIEEAAGDVFKSQLPLINNSLFIDEQALGLTPGFFGDDLDALELDSRPKPFTYFSIDFLSATNDFGAADLQNDILVSDGNDAFDVYAFHQQIGLQVGDDIDALVLIDILDGDLDPVADPGIDFALFSLDQFSPSTFTFTGLDYGACVSGRLSPADVCITDFNGGFGLWASALDLGLRPDDNLDALDTIPAPASIFLLGLGLLGILVNQLRPVNGGKL